jgi:hypothetical protein
MASESSFTLLPASVQFPAWRAPQEASLRREIRGSSSEARGRVRSVLLWYSVVPTITLHSRIIARLYFDKLGNDVHPVIQTLFPNNGEVFQDGNAPIYTAGTL